VTVFWRYWLLQIPGWVLLVVLLILARDWLGISTTAAVVILAAWIVKDAAIYPWLRPHYQLRSDDLKDALIGATARAEQPLNPKGYVKLRGELWLAELATGEPPVSPGETVTVEGVEGLTLRVRRGQSLTL
jgi:membrane protein implicated in regulation of membrane protease activity